MPLNGTYCYGDIHQCVVLVERFLRECKPARVIWLGDYFDNFNDEPYQAGATAYLIRKLMHERPQDVFILGNHDLPYLLTDRHEFHDKHCGWTHEKSHAINDIFGPEEWKRLKVWHAEDGVVFSHAGIHPTCTIEELPGKLKPGTDHLVDRTYTPQELLPLVSLDGPLWIRDKLRVNKFNQIFGHTPLQRPNVTKGFRNWNLNLDCAHIYHAHIKEDHVYQVDWRQGSEKVLVPLSFSQEPDRVQ